MLISITITVIISQQYFLYTPAIFVPINATSIPAPTRHPPQTTILISQYIIPATTGLDIPILICAMFFPVSTTQPAMVCVKVAIVSKNTTQSEINILLFIWKLLIKLFCFPLIYKIAFRCGILSSNSIKITRYKFFTQKE